MGVVLSCRRLGLCSFPSSQEDIPVPSVMTSSKNKSTTTCSSSSSSSSSSIKNEPPRPFFRTRNDINTSEATSSAPTDDAKPSRDSAQPIKLPDNTDACYALSLQVAVDRETFDTTMQQETTANGVNGDSINNNQDSSEIESLDHVNNDQEGDSMLDDHDLAIKPQADLDGDVTLPEASLQAERDMMNTSVGKAWKFVDQVLCVHGIIQASPLSSSYDDQTMDKSTISTIGFDEFLYMVGRMLAVERMLAAQECFQTSGKPTHVDIGYHYTRAGNMDGIQTDGLMTHPEREANQIHTNFNGAILGDGVYTGNNPFAFHEYAQSDVGILVARLRGQTGTRTDQDGVDTAVRCPGTFSETVVPGSSFQCVALVSFSSSMIHQRETTPGSDLIHKYHCELQRVIDDIFNGGKATKVPKVLPEKHNT
jgi:hypothetical protein